MPHKKGQTTDEGGVDENNTGKEKGRFPLEALRRVLSSTVTGSTPKSLMTNDISARDINSLVHGDDFVSSEDRENLEWLYAGLRNNFDTRKVMTDENGGLRWHPQKGLTCEANPRDADTIIHQTGAEQTKIISTLMTKGPEQETLDEKSCDLSERMLKGQIVDKIEDEDEGKLKPEEITRLRKLSARATFLAQERIDKGFATKETTRRMAAPK